MKVTPDSTLRDMMATPVGSDLVKMVAYHAGIPDHVIRNPLIGRLKLRTLPKLLGDKLPMATVEHLCDLVGYTPEPVVLAGKAEPKWWKEAVIYQIYPRSFMDANGDGIGDLPGILSRLDYLKDLGVDALWLSPIYDSPNDDMGYDIRDYRKIMTEFGTMEDFDTLLAEIHKRGMKLIMDLVVNHTSDEHAWFQKALAGDEKYKNYYIFRKGKGPGVPPNNWTSLFSGPAWNYYPELDEWALHLFSKKQMDLNWENPELRAEVADMVCWWLEKGVDGFRMDVINMISKVDGLPDGNSLVGEVIGYGGEYYFWGPRLQEYLHELNENAFKKYPDSFCVGETGGIGTEMAKFLVDDSREEIRETFLFDQLETPGKERWSDYRYDLKYLKQLFTRYQLEMHGSSWPTLVIENHDNPRMVSKVNPDSSFRRPLSKLIGAMLLTGRGTPYIFEGEELGMMNCDFNDMSEIRDVESINKYDALLKKGKTPAQAWRTILAGSRDHGRTPMCWDATENAGFTSGTPWIRVNGDYQTCNAEAEAADPFSPLHYYKALIALRKAEKETLVYGDFLPLKTDDRTFCFYRESAVGKFYIEMNLTQQWIKRPRAAEGVCALSNYAKPTGQLRPYEVNLYRI
ncbi:MAG: alpha-glucosidase [Clostridia bacterium]|nr:alpha-glucosidase [Clostridia bacterium]